MKRVLIPVIILISAVWSFPAHALTAEQRAAMDELRGLDGVQAVAIANEWNWEEGVKGEVWSYVTPQEVFFVFNPSEKKNRKIVRIPLPEDEMVVSVMPYIRKTHK